MKSSLKPKHCLLIVSLLLCLQKVSAQRLYHELSFRIDSLSELGLPKSALKEVEKLDNLAQKENNTSMQVRAVIYRMKLQSYLQEEALQAIISSLRLRISRAEYPVKPVLESLLAEMYWNYYTENRDKFNQRSRLLKPDTDFTKWDLQTVIAQASSLYDASLRDAAREQNTPVKVLDGVLAGDSTTRYLRPTLYDLLVQRGFDFFFNDEASLPQPKMPFSLNDPRFFADSRTFAALTIKTTDTASIQYKGMIYLQQATAFHMTHNDAEALADLDLKRLTVLYNHSGAEKKDSLYLAGLDDVATRFSAKPISADALYLEGQYWQQKDSLVTAHGFLKKAFVAWPKSHGGKNAMLLLEQIEQKALSASVENIYTAGEPVLALLNFANITKATARVYRLSSEEYNAITGHRYLTSYSDDINDSDLLEKTLKKLNPVQQQDLALPDAGDYKRHSAEFKIDPLAPGNYVVLVRDDAGKKLSAAAAFVTTRLSCQTRTIPSGEVEVQVIDRLTGAPLKNVNVSLYGWVAGKPEVRVDLANGVSDTTGRFVAPIGDNNYIVSLSKGADKFTSYVQSYSRPLKVDTVGHTYENNYFYTDRQLYRPGQTIYFKLLKVSSNNGQTKIMPGEHLTVSLNDNSFKIISTLEVVTNEFGSAGGSFVIPQNVAGGFVHLSADFNNFSVRVEEYKRPSFQVSFLPVNQIYKPNDSVTVKGKAIAFSGYGLSNARVAVKVNRRILGPVYKTGALEYAPDMGSQLIKTDTIQTNGQGEFEVKFKAAPGDKPSPGNAWSFELSADATDESGETQSAQTTVNVSEKPVEIEAGIPAYLRPGDSTRSFVRLMNINRQAEKGTLQVTVMALKSPQRLFKARLWDVPDEHILNKDEFEKSFPDYAWKQDDELGARRVEDTVWKENIALSDSTANTISLASLKNRPGGIYKVMMTAKDAKGDTASLTQFVRVIAPGNLPQAMDNWVTPLEEHPAPGGEAVFLVGTLKPSHILVEVSYRDKLIRSQWLSLPGGPQQKVTVPVPAGLKQRLAVQFLMVCDNRLYQYTEQIATRDTAKKLNLKFLTFRNKLLPGQKEQWKMQLTLGKNEAPSAELLAAMYDASLDDIAPPQTWIADFTGQPYFYLFYTWNYGQFVRMNEGLAFGNDEGYFSNDERIYEQLNLMGYNYYGNGNQSYQGYAVFTRQAPAMSDRGLRKKYLANAALIKDGFDMSGKIISSSSLGGIPGAKITIKGTGISTYSDSHGYFRIKVPANGILIISHKGCPTRQVKAVKGTALIITLMDSNRYGLMQIADPGVKYIKGEANAVATIDEPVGSADMAVTENAPVVRELKFNAPNVKYDKEASSARRLDSTNAFKSEYKMMNLSLLDKAVSPAKPIIPRTNFNETAFFYPQLHTDEKGQILIDFTIPEALTRWKFRGLAYARNLQTGYIEAEVVTQKQLSISANTPRFLREGDTITVSARLANLTAATLKGKVSLQLFNAINMQPVRLLVNNADAIQDFTVDGNTNKAISFKLAIPAGLDALDYRLSADAGTFTDGEENTLPVLPNRTLVTESMPMMVRAGQTKAFTFDKLVNQQSTTLKNKTLTLEYTSNPAWYAVQALPYMMEFPYECSEQTFSRYFANSLAMDIISKNPAIKRVFEQWKNSNSTELLSNLEKNQELKATLIEETPWLRDAENETEQKKRIGLLFDLNKMSNELKLALDKLQKLQLFNGGFTWFGGSYADRYITQHIVEGMGELHHLHIGDDQDQLRQMRLNALGHMKDDLLRDEKERKKDKNGQLTFGDLEIHAWFARSYFADLAMNSDEKAALNHYLAWAESNWTSRNVYEQGMIALTMQRFDKPDVTMQIEKSLLETAQQSDELGMYWGKNQRGYYWYESPIETQSLLIELFTEAGDNTKAVDEMKVWLLRNKQTNNWQTTKATASACYALLLKGSNLLADTGATTIKLGGKPLSELKPDVKADAGTGYLKTSWQEEQIKPALGKVEVTNNSKTISWGALHWQYLESLDKITSANTNIRMRRKYFIQKETDAGAVLTEVDASHQPKVGDLLKVVVYLDADRDFEYVQLKDMRPAGTEPVDALSTYKYQDGLYYYQVTKDVATNFFISYLNKGSYVFEYRLRVAQPGNFSTGITGIQCMYAPEFNAHSEGGRMQVKP